MSKKTYQAVIDSPIPGVPSIGICVEGGCLREIDFLFRHQAPFVEDAAQTTVRLLQDYFQQRDIPGSAIEVGSGTPFQRRVWQELTHIPPGETRSYGELAKKLRSSARAVAGACRRNPISLLVPCHRVVSKHSLGGFMGKTDGPALAIKRWLLQHEGHE